MTRNLIAVVSSVMLSTQVFGYGDQGHKTIWTIAQGYLHPATKQKVAAILAGDKLSLTPVWLDKARSAAVTLSSSRNAVSISSARTIKR